MLVKIFLLALLATATVNWQQSADPKTIGYKIHYANYSTPPFNREVDVGLTTSHTFTNLSTQKLYCYAVTLYSYTSARQTGYVESSYSNKQCGTVNVHSNYPVTPNYRTSGTPNYPPLGTPYFPLPVCSQCHTGTP